MGVGPDGACGGSSGGGDSWAHSTAVTTSTSANETATRTLVMAGESYHAADAPAALRQKNVTVDWNDGSEVTLYHVSEEPDIEGFEPRRIDGAHEALVWAIDDARLHNYLLPRECPRVTFYAGPRTSVADRERFLGSSLAVVAIEAAWFPRLQSCRLFCYHLPADNFACHDETAGYFVSRTAVKPVAVECISDPVSAILQRGVELRILPNLCSFRDAVVESTLEFSIIRWRNASPTTPGRSAFGVVPFCI